MYKKKKKDIKRFSNIIIDTNNLFWRSFYTETKSHLNTPGKKKVYTAGKRTAFYAVKNLLEDYSFKNTKVFFLLDNAESKIDIRKEIDPEYKHTRKKAPDGFYLSLDGFIQIIYNYSPNYYICYADELEADDLVPHILKYIDEKSTFKDTLLVSNDLDWSRELGRENVSWFNWKGLYSKSDFKIEFGFNPEYGKICLYKTLMGDKADNIKSISRWIKQSNAVYVANHYNSLNEFFLNYQYSKLPDIVKHHITINERSIRSNWYLVTYKGANKNVSDCIKQGRRNPNELKKYFLKYDIELEDDFPHLTAKSEGFLLMPEIPYIGRKIKKDK